MAKWNFVEFGLLFHNGKVKATYLQKERKCNGNKEDKK